jgi:hypothetical protein
MPRGLTFPDRDPDHRAPPLPDSDHLAAPLGIGSRESGPPPAARRSESTPSAAETPKAGSLLLVSHAAILEAVATIARHPLVREARRIVQSSPAAIPQSLSPGAAARALRFRSSPKLCPATNGVRVSWCPARGWTSHGDRVAGRRGRSPGTSQARPPEFWRSTSSGLPVRWRSSILGHPVSEITPRGGSSVKACRSNAEISGAALQRGVSFASLIP